MKYFIIFIVLNILLGVVYSDGNVTPQSIKIAFSQSIDQIRITWYTEDISEAPVILYNTQLFSPEKDSSLAVQGEVISYKSEDSNFVGHPNTAVIEGLSDFTTYYYCVGDKSVGVYSQIYNFTTGITSNIGQFESFTLAFYGDMGFGGVGLQSDFPTINNVLSRDDISFIIHVGDIAYADLGASTELTGNQTIWNGFLESITPLATHLPYMTCPGNHDLFYDDLSVYSRTWQMPTDKDSDTWYSFDYNGVHFVGFSSEHDYTPLSPQFAWLENELKTYRQSNPDGWLVAYSHRPFYCSAIWDWCDDTPSDSITHHNDSLGKETFNLIEDLLYQYNVDLYLAGHQHAEEYSVPVYKGKNTGSFDEPKATVHITVGTGGNADGSIAGWQSRPTWAGGERTVSPGFAMLTFYNSTSLGYKFVANVNNTIIDEFTLTKGSF
ncbi:hypothetical protein DICPUDRAFT_86395 [Dictyostelium purpureum]|uniref:Purple acid phosphatase n=1 Tax=Dictyostelium purpureum TaxID=5786 RepID=F0ZBD1_DICPU|nr:uncharacterized protein DICPUDRAFT_86395 [Dictyostelium purpureum]EGC38724.1 hypothetical protein DICPUDRAFT_86395 [Dictyostelium purpureum]|eukprot:XP_003284715.1 hypothetical protein DICPUDRAFT_86395 [Dictyostelium purpureum]